jgi:hypothetical protein
MAGSKQNLCRMENVGDYSSDEEKSLAFLSTSDVCQKENWRQEGNLWGNSSDEGKSLAFLPTSDVWQ